MCFLNITCRRETFEVLVLPTPSGGGTDGTACLQGRSYGCSQTCVEDGEGDSIPLIKVFLTELTVADIVGVKEYHCRSS